MPVRYVYRDGSTVPGDVRITPDHFVTTFSLNVTMDRDVFNQVRDAIQKKHEVVGMHTTLKITTRTLSRVTQEDIQTLLGGTVNIISAMEPDEVCIVQNKPPIR